MGDSKIGLDCPLGWPEPFVEFVRRHHDERVLDPTEQVADRRHLAYRATDLALLERGFRPLSVSADRIGHVAFRAASLLPKIDDSTDRSGAGRVVETYPASSLQVWQAPHHRGYKGSARATERSELAEWVVERSGVEADETTLATIRGSDHALDALVAALTALAAARGLVEPVPDGHLDLARREGWIRLPACALKELAAGPGRQHGAMP